MSFKFRVIFLGLLFPLFLASRFMFEEFRELNDEECHTGAVIRELTQNGFRFPIEQYTPEYYENSILVASALGMAPAAVLGVTPLALKIVPACFAFGCLALGIALLNRAGFRNGIWFYVVIFSLGFTNFIFQSVDAVGNHIIGLFAGTLILYLYYGWHVTGRIRVFYLMLFVAGLGLFLHPASLLYSVMCATVYVLCRPAAGGSRPVPGARQGAWGVMWFLAGLVPFLVFFIKTRALTVAHFSQNASHYLPATVGEFMSFAGSAAWEVFDRRAWLAGLFAALFGVCLVYLWRRKPGLTDRARLLIFLVCLFTAGAFAAALLNSGGVRMRYFTYFYQPLFLAGAVAVSLAMDVIEQRSRTLRVLLQSLLACVLVIALVAGKRTDFSWSRARSALMAREASFCYWRFGRAFEHYTDFNQTQKAFASDIKHKCDRFDHQAQRLECYWGWSANSARPLDADTVRIFGAEGSRALAAGAGFGAERGVETCFSDRVPPGFAGDCVAGYLHKELGRFRPMTVPCLPTAPRFSGLIQVQRQALGQGDVDAEAAKCDALRTPSCAVMAGYCGALSGQSNLCSRIHDPGNAALCRSVFQKVSEAPGLYSE